MATAETPKKENELAKLKAPVQEIIDFAEGLKDKYQEKCFEVLFNYYLYNNGVSYSASASNGGSAPKTPLSGTSPLSLSMRGFLAQNNISENIITKLFIIENGEAIPTFKISETKKAVAQIQLSLLAALQNALVTPAALFEFSVDKVREQCKEHNVYDMANFNKTFKTNANLFIDLGEGRMKLSPEGKTELAETINLVSEQ